MLIWFLFLLSLLHLPCREFIEVGTDLKFDFYSKSSYITEAKSSEKAKITIAIMLPQDYIRLRNFNVCIKKEMDRINRGNWSFNKHFYLDRFFKQSNFFYLFYIYFLVIQLLYIKILMI